MDRFISFIKKVFQYRVSYLVLVLLLVGFILLYRSCYHNYFRLYDMPEKEIQKESQEQGSCYGDSALNKALTALENERKKDSTESTFDYKKEITGSGRARGKIKSEIMDNTMIKVELLDEYYNGEISLSKGTNLYGKATIREGTVYCNFKIAMSEKTTTAVDLYIVSVEGKQGVRMEDVIKTKIVVLK